MVVPAAEAQQIVLVERSLRTQVESRLQGAEESLYSAVLPRRSRLCSLMADTQHLESEPEERGPEHALVVRSQHFRPAESLDEIDE